MDFGFAMPVVTPWKLGKLWYGDRLRLDWQPKTKERMRTIFKTLGLQGDFWSVP